MIPQFAILFWGEGGVEFLMRTPQKMIFLNFGMKNQLNALIN